MSVIDTIAKAVKEFKAKEPEVKIDNVGFHDFITAEYMHRLKQDQETATWLLKHPDQTTTN